MLYEWLAALLSIYRSIKRFVPFQCKRFGFHRRFLTSSYRRNIMDHWFRRSVHRYWLVNLFFHEYFSFFYSLSPLSFWLYELHISTHFLKLMTRFQFIRFNRRLSFDTSSEIVLCALKLSDESISFESWLLCVTRAIWKICIFCVKRYLRCLYVRRFKDNLRNYLYMILCLLDTKARCLST